MAKGWVLLFQGWLPYSMEAPSSSTVKEVASFTCLPQPGCDGWSIFAGSFCLYWVWLLLCKSFAQGPCGWANGSKNREHSTFWSNINPTSCLLTSQGKLYPVWAAWWNHRELGKLLSFWEETEGSLREVEISCKWLICLPESSWEEKCKGLRGYSSISEQVGWQEDLTGPRPQIPISCVPYHPPHSRTYNFLPFCFWKRFLLVARV